MIFTEHEELTELKQYTAVMQGGIMLILRRKAGVSIIIGLSMLFAMLPLPHSHNTAYASEQVLDISDYGPVSDSRDNIIRVSENRETEASSEEANQPQAAAVTSMAYAPSMTNLSRLSSSGSRAIGDTVKSKYAAVYDLDSNRIAAAKNADAVIYPASMTKIMTVLVCAERLGNLDEVLTVTQDIVDYVHANDASNCGFKAGDKVSVRDLLYGVVLPSGADAVLMLCRRIAGSEAEFVKLMNQKAAELKLSSNTNFTNASGLFNEKHKTTLGDMAEILNAAMKNPTAREVLSTHKHTTAGGKSFSNLFLRRIEDQKLGGAVVRMAKTGYVRQSMFCAASYGTTQSGKHYIVVTAYGPSTWQCIYDQAALYRDFCE